MKLLRFFSMWLFLAATGFGQFTENPLDELKQQVAKVLADAKVPFTSEQETQLALVMEEQRRATEDFFGVIMDFKDGPPQGAQRDQALAAIQWMHDEFRKRLPSFLTDSQRAAWEAYESAGQAISAPSQGAVAGAPRRLVQQIRVTNNAFNAETQPGPNINGPSGGGVRTEVIERGGSGAYHGNFSASFQDEKFNARNPSASNKPPYYERNINAGINGPIIPNRLTLSFSLSDRRAENVGTVTAETLAGPFTLGVTRPNLRRSYDTNGVLQLANAHSVHFSVGYANERNLNQGVGSFTLPERASNSKAIDYTASIREISALSERAVHDLRFEITKSHDETNPLTNAVAITVLDAFSGGGAQNRIETDRSTYEFGNLFYYQGQKLTLRAGTQGVYIDDRSRSENNFLGEFTFSDLAGYRDRLPLKFKVTQGDPLFDLGQMQMGLFVQNDIRLTNRFTLLLGMRYDVQSNISDKNNFQPRASFAYALGDATVIRGGLGIFNEIFNFNDVLTIRRLDGRRLSEIQVDNPISMDDPFSSGTVRVIPPSSRRVFAPELSNLYWISSLISLEQTLPHNLFVSVSFDHNRSVHILRVRNINAPLPGTCDSGACIKPFPDEGLILQSESSGKSVHKNLKLSLRQRFSIFTVNSSYTYYSGYNDDSSGRLGGIATDSYNIKADWGRGTANPTHRFSTTINAQLPLDIVLAGVINVRSGSFYTVTTGRDDNKDGTTNDRPVGADAIALCGEADAFNRCPRTSKTGPGYFNLDFNLTKVIQLTRQTEPRGTGAASGPQMNVFANLNNAFNMTHPGVPSGVVTSPFFGQSFNASGERTIQVGMRFQF